MSGKSLKFGDKKIKKSDFYNNKKPFNIHSIDVDKILIGYNDNDVITPLFLKLPQMVGYLKCFKNKKKSMSFKVNNKEMLKTISKYGKELAV